MDGARYIPHVKNAETRSGLEVHRVRSREVSGENDHKRLILDARTPAARTEGLLLLEELQAPRCGTWSRLRDWRARTQADARAPGTEATASIR